MFSGKTMSPEIMKPEVHKDTRALIFDMDGTLADSMPVHFLAWKQTAAENGFEYTHECFLKTAGMPTHKIVPVINRHYGLNLDPEKFSRRKEEIFLENIAGIKPITEIAEIVKEYYNILPMSIGTGGKKRIAIKTLEIMGLKNYFNIIVSAEDVQKHKPYPDTFLKCAELMGVEPEFCQVFEDGEMGLQAARKAGMIVTDVRQFLS
jgi:beta-phosphoglucomutase family hydrolase